MKVVTMLSGGLDSTTLLYHLLAEGHEVPLALSFDYGQRHARELEAARVMAEKVGVPWRVIDLTSVTGLLRGSALTDDVEVPEGHYAEESMRVTVVPNRNAMMLGIAFAAAVGLGADAVAFGPHAGDHAIYPDCREEFVLAFEEMERIANEGYARVALITPFVNLTKTDIAARAVVLGVPIADTWSCYRGGTRHCGRCGTCYERIEAMRDAGAVDLTAYEDPV